MILLLGGTSETGPLAAALADAGFRILVSTATDAPLGLGDHPRVRRRSGPLDGEGLAALLRAEGAEALVDATHPYAEQIRRTARGVAERVGVPYLTYVRPAAAGDAEGVLRAADHGEAARLACSFGEPVLLTTGSRNLEPYAREAERAGVRLAARVLDREDSREACRRVGLASDRVIAERGPFGVEITRRHLREQGARVLVTKDSGAVGGLPEKLEAARLEGCRVVLVGRPEIPDQDAFPTLEALVTAVKERRAAAGPQEHGGNLREVEERYGLDRVLDFSASINPLGHPEGLREHLWACWDRVLHYPDRGVRRFRDAAAARYGLPATCVVPGNGSAEIIGLALRALAPRRLVLAPPDFSLYADLAPAGTPRVEVPRQEACDFASDLPALADALAPGDVLIFSNPGNPSGAVVPREAVLELAEAAAGRGALLLLDEAFVDFCPAAAVLDRVPEARGLAVLRSLTKFYGIPGLRLGFLAAPAALAEQVRALQCPWSVNALAEEAGVHCLAAPDWEARTLACVAEERRRLSEGLAAIPGLRPLPSAANYLLLEVAAPAPPARTIYDAAARRGVLVRHCGSFGLGERYLRVAVRTAAENRRLLEVLGDALGVGSEAG